MQFNSLSKHFMTNVTKGLHLLMTSHYVQNTMQLFIVIPKVIFVVK